MKTKINCNVAQKVNAEVKWVPGYSNNIGIEEADTAACAAPRSLPLLQTQCEHMCHWLIKLEVWCLPGRDAN